MWIPGLEGMAFVHHILWLFQKKSQYLVVFAEKVGYLGSLGTGINTRILKEALRK
jgi:hypothetical protein